MPFRVTLDVYQGPLDLLLHLVRRQELPIEHVRIASVTEQFLEHVAVLEQLDIDSIGDFLDVASLLIEIKSRTVLPRHEEEDPEPTIQASQHDLVQRLLEYKKFRDAAGELEERGVAWRRRFARAAPDLPRRAASPDEQPIVAVELWDLVSAFGRVMQEKLEPPTATTIPYDPTPVHVYMRRVHARLVADGETLFSDLFPSLVHKSTLIATFLAVLELVRHGHARAEQREAYGDLLVSPGDQPLPDGPRLAAVTSDSPASE